MPFVTKASRRVKKPAYQRGTNPPLKEQRDAQAIVANHEQKFSRSFNKLLRDLLTPEMLKLIEVAIREEVSADDIIKRIPFFDPDAPETFAIWEGFAMRMESTYAGVIDDAVQNENRKRGWKIEIEKVEDPEIPVNPSTRIFIRGKALKRVVDISEKERERLRDILSNGLGVGARPSAMMDEIQDTVGITVLQNQRLRRKLQGARAAGMSIELVKKLRASESTKIRAQRAKAIARTETNEALAHGLNTSWRQASNQGVMPPGTMKQWVAMPFEEGRSSDICQDLDGQVVGINETFSSSEGEGFNGEGPPSHPNCRSTMSLIFP